MATMSKEEREDWIELYEYVKKNIMQYDFSQKLSKKMILRLRGLQKGKFLDNKNIKDESNYSFKIILLTYKYCYYDINNILKTKVFDSEEHKFNYIASIVENKLNDVYVRMNNQRRKEDELKKANLEDVTNNSASYTRKTDDTNNKQLEEFW